MRVDKSQKLWLLVGLILPFGALALNWPQSTSPTGARSPRNGGEVEIDNTAEPMGVVIRNVNGQLQAEITQGQSEWLDSRGRKCSATIQIRRVKPK